MVVTLSCLNGFQYADAQTFSEVGEFCTLILGNGIFCITIENVCVENDDWYRTRLD